jgi:hypothetical protein
LIETGRAIEAKLGLDDLSGQVYLGNSVRGLVKAEPVAGVITQQKTPGHGTGR